MMKSIKSQSIFSVRKIFCDIELSSLGALSPSFSLPHADKHSLCSLSCIHLSRYEGTLCLTLTDEMIHMKRLYINQQSIATFKQLMSNTDFLHKWKSLHLCTCVNFLEKRRGGQCGCDYTSRGNTKQQNTGETNWYMPKNNVLFSKRLSSGYNYVKVCHPACLPVSFGSLTESRLEAITPDDNKNHLSLCSSLTLLAVPRPLCWHR